jgi:hypothetical protein
MKITIRNMFHAYSIGFCVITPVNAFVISEILVRLSDNFSIAT